MTQHSCRSGSIPAGLCTTCLLEGPCTHTPEPPFKEQVIPWPTCHFINWPPSSPKTASNCVMIYPCFASYIYPRAHTAQLTAQLAQHTALLTNPANKVSRFTILPSRARTTPSSWQTPETEPAKPYPAIHPTLPTCVDGHTSEQAGSTENGRGRHLAGKQEHPKKNPPLPNHCPHALT